MNKVKTKKMPDVTANAIITALCPTGSIVRYSPLQTLEVDCPMNIGVALHCLTYAVQTNATVKASRKVHMKRQYIFRGCLFRTQKRIIRNTKLTKIEPRARPGWDSIKFDAFELYMKIAQIATVQAN